MRKVFAFLFRLPLHLLSEIIAPSRPSHPMGAQAGFLSAIAGPLASAAIGKIFSGKAGAAESGGFSEAQEITEEEVQEALATVRAAGERTQSRLNPFERGGREAFETLTGELDELTRPFTLADFEADPGFEFRVEEGEKAINRAAGAAGSRFSGATLKSLNRFNQRSASDEFGRAFGRFRDQQDNRFNRFRDISGIGVNAATNAASLDESNASTQANIRLRGALTRGQAAIGAGQARASQFRQEGDDLTRGLSGAIEDIIFRRQGGTEDDPDAP